MKMTHEAAEMVHEVVKIMVRGFLLGQVFIATVSTVLAYVI